MDEIERLQECMITVDVVRRTPVLNIRRKRLLPFPGRVLVDVGDAVHPEDVIAEASIPGDILEMDVARALNIAPSEAVSSLIRDVGEHLEQGDVLAKNEGAFTRVVRMPCDGKFIGWYQGTAILAAGKTLVQSRAGMIGVVEEVIPEYGAVLAVHGSLIQGVWGNGMIGTGVIKVMAPPIANPVDITMIESLEKGQIFAAGICKSADVLTVAEKIELTGLILGVLAPDLIQNAAGLSIPVIVLQGFGEFHPDPPSFAILRSRSGAIASINAAENDLNKGSRPEVIIPQAGSGPDETDLHFRAKIVIGQWVQVNSGDVWGQTGEVIDLPDESIKFESGLSCLPAVVRLDSGEMVTAPQQNLIILGGTKPVM